MLLLQIALNEPPNLGRKHGRGAEVFGLPTPFKLRSTASMSKLTQPARRGMFRWGNLTRMEVIHPSTVATSSGTTRADESRSKGEQSDHKTHKSQRAEAAGQDQEAEQAADKQDPDCRVQKFACC